MSHDIPSLLFLAILSIRASCRIRTNDPEITCFVPNLGDLKGAGRRRLVRMKRSPYLEKAVQRYTINL